MNDILFGNNNTKTIKRLSKQYFKKNKVRNLAAILAIVLTAFLFTSITSLAFNMVSSMQLLYADAERQQGRWNLRLYDRGAI